MAKQATIFGYYAYFNLPVFGCACYTIGMVSSLVNPKALGEISKDLGQIFFASVFLTSLMSGTVNYLVIVTGLVLSIVFWSAYIITREY